MRNIYKLFIIAIAMLSLTTVNASDLLTNKIVNNLLEKMDKTTVDLDARALGRLLSDDVAIKIVLPKKNDKQRMLSPTKKQYISLLEKSWKTSKGYSYKRYNVKTEILKSRAIVTFDTKETIKVNGKYVDSYAKDQMLIEGIKGKALITKIVSFLQK